MRLAGPYPVIIADSEQLKTADVPSALARAQLARRTVPPSSVSLLAAAPGWMADALEAVAPKEAPPRILRSPNVEREPSVIRQRERVPSVLREATWCAAGYPVGRLERCRAIGSCLGGKSSKRLAFTGRCAQAKLTRIIRVVITMDVQDISWFQEDEEDLTGYCDLKMRSRPDCGRSC